MILEHHTTNGWQPIGTIGHTAGRAFLQRCQDPRLWRLRDGSRVWKIEMWSGRVVTWIERKTKRRNNAHRSPV